MTRIWAAVGTTLLSSTVWAQALVLTASDAPTLSAAERLAALQAAGFKPQGKRLIGCDSAPGFPPSQIDLQVLDLNGDGQPEALIHESNPVCYAQPGTAFRLVTRDAHGKWHRIAEEVGVPRVLDTRTMDWPDIEIGGPDYGTMPVIGWNGTGYVRKR